MTITFPDEAENPVVGISATFSFSGEGRRPKEGCFIWFNTLKRSDDLLLFKTGMHFSPCLCCKRQKRKPKCLPVERHNWEDSNFYRLSGAKLSFPFDC